MQMSAHDRKRTGRFLPSAAARRTGSPRHLRRSRLHELPHVAMIKFEQRHIVDGIGGIDNIHAPVVEDEPMLLLAYGKHSMEIQPARLGPDHDQAAIFAATPTSPSAKYLAIA